MPIIRDFNKDLVPMDNPIEARKNDLIRITEWLASPAGLKFAGKQALLRTTGNLDSFSRKDILKAAGRGTADAASAIAMILAQVPLNGTGTHFLFNELSSLVFQQDSFYTNNRFASMQAKYKGVITISANKDGGKNRFRGDKTWEDIGFGNVGAAKSDDIGRQGMLGDPSKDEFAKAMIETDTLPVVISVAGVANSTLLFRGFVENLSDGINANWNSYNYVGRGETMYTYSNSTRAVTFNLQVPMFSELEQAASYKKANSLMSYAYPKYDDGTNLAQGTLLKLRIGDFLNEYAVMTSVSQTINTDVPWSKGNAEVLLPQVLTFTLNFNIIHRRLPERYTDHSSLNPFIAPGGKNYTVDEQV